MASGADTQTHTYRRANQNNFKKQGAHGLWPRAPGLKISKQVRGQNYGERKQVKDEAQGLLYLEKNSKAISFPILAASGL